MDTVAEVAARIPGIDTLADLIDRLCVEVHKLAWFENRKREEQAKKPRNAKLIMELDNRSRDCCELRSMVKSEINRLLQEILTSGQYKAAREVRTFSKPGRGVAEVLADRFYDIGNVAVRGEIAEALERELGL